MQILEDDLQHPIHIALETMVEVAQFKEILKKALNTADPIEWAPWFKISDKIDNILTKQKGEGLMWDIRDDASAT